MRYQPGVLKVLRVKHGLSRAVVANHIGVSEPTLMRWEAGQGGPSVTDLDLLAEALKVSGGNPAVKLFRLLFGNGGKNGPRKRQP